MGLLNIIKKNFGKGRLSRKEKFLLDEHEKGKILNIEKINNKERSGGE